MNEQNAYTYQSIYEVRLLLLSTMLVSVCILCSQPPQLFAELIVGIIILWSQYRHMKSVTTENDQAIARSMTQDEPPTLKHYGYMSLFLIEIFTFLYLMFRLDVNNQMAQHDKIILIGLFLILYLCAIILTYYITHKIVPRNNQPQ